MNSAATPIRTRIWHEEAEPDNPFATRTAYCRGYDVFGDMVGHARWCEMLLLLLRDERPAALACDLLEALAVALANPGPRDPSVHAAMCGGVGGATAAAALMAALAVGAGGYGGAREVRDAMAAWMHDGEHALTWSVAPGDTTTAIDVWPPREYPPGFDPYGVSTPTSVGQLLTRLTRIGQTPRLLWLEAHRTEVESAAAMPLALTGVAAAALGDLGCTPAEGEMLYLLLRLPGAAAHALEQHGHGYKQFPFPDVALDDDPAVATT